MKQKRKNIVIGKIKVEGFHFYPTPPQLVEYLAQKHRHTFEITFGYQVTDLDREKEIFIERNRVLSFVFSKYPKVDHEVYFTNRSCEMIANEILSEFEDDGMIFCEVWEEQTGGARVEVASDYWK